MSKYRYREVKNYIHNELKLTKEDIREIMIPIIREEVKRVMFMKDLMMVVNGIFMKKHLKPDYRKH